MQKYDDRNERQEGETLSATGRSRGRPRVFDREIALGKATHLFWEKGFHATSISDLTQVMEIGSPSLYAAFGSKEELFAEALTFYQRKYEGFIWDGFFSAATVREAIKRYLMDSAAAFSGSLADTPRGCMVTLSTVGDEGYAELGEMVRSSRQGVRLRLETRLQQAVQDNEIPQSLDISALARFVQAVQSGMALLSRDRASCANLEAVAEAAMQSCDAQFNSSGTLAAQG